MKYLIHTSICLAMLLTTGLLSADSILLPPGSDIQAAINSLGDGDTIQLQTGTYQPEETLNMNGKAIRLVGELDSNGFASSIIDGRDLISLFKCNQNEPPETVFENLVFFAGNATLKAINGGAVAIAGSGKDNHPSPTFKNCVFFGNHAADGGAVHVNKGAPRFSQCTFINNTASEYGGALYCALSANVVLEDSLIAQNIASIGGCGVALFFESDATITNCSFVENSNSTSSSSVFINYYSDPEVTDCRFERNLSSSLETSISNPTLIRCVFEDNESRFDAGAIRNGPESLSTLIECTITGNTAVFDGGGISTESNSDLALVDTTICDNQPDQIFPADKYINGGGNFIVTSCACSADINGDGVVNGADITFVFGFWGTSNATSDINNDGVVSGEDITVILSQWGDCP